MADRETVTAEPTDVGEAKRQVERNRERISETLDAIEHRIVDKKEQLRERMDVARPLRERVQRTPWKAVGAAAGVGVALALLVGGGGSRSSRKASRGLDIPDADTRRDLRRLRRQRRERLAGRLDGAEGHEGTSHLSSGREKSGGGRSRLGRELRRQLIAAAGTALLQGLRDRVLHGDGRR
jgi:ElaB/YqjD/DUF883 family membrane-anchored ribosome-binding protein